MAENLKLFNEHSEYEDFILTKSFIKPNVSYCIQEDEVHYNGDYSEDYLTFRALEDGTFSFSTNDIDYSLNNGETWTTLTAGTSTPTVSAGEKIMWKASGLTPTSSAGIGTFSSTGQFKVVGNIMSLVSGDNFTEATTVVSDHFHKLFNECTGLISAKNLVLPATTLASSCYSSMFRGCASLTTAPELPATTLASSCYSSMFQGCASLTTAPELPATTLASNCYSYMFYDCTSLTTAPSVLPATTLESECYRAMFSGCSSLTTAPSVLPAMTLADSCYSSMFRYCSKLNYIKAMFTTTPNSNYTFYWVQGVAPTGTFVKNSAAEWDVTGANGIPTNWTVQTASA